MAIAMLQFTTGNSLPDLICLQLMEMEQQHTDLHTNSNAAQAIDMHFAWRAHTFRAEGLKTLDLARCGAAAGCWWLRCACRSGLLAA